MDVRNRMANLRGEAHGRLKSRGVSRLIGAFMANRVFTFISKLARKLVMAVLIASLALVTYSLWLFGREQSGYDERRAQLTASTEAERISLRGQLQELNRKIEETTRALDGQRQRAVQAEKAIKALHELDPGAIDRVFGDGEQQRANDAQLVRMEALKTEAQTRIVELQAAAVVNEGARAELAQRVADVEREEDALKREKHAIEHYLRTAWREARWLVIAVFSLYLFGGLLLALVLYYGWAAWVGRGRPVELPTSGAAAPVVGESAVVVENAVWPGEVLWVRRKFLHANDEGLTRRNRLLLNWRMPLSCFAGGLVRLIELRNGRSGGERRVVFTNAEDNFAELAIVSVPEGGSFVLRAGFLMGLIAGLDQPPVIRRHWRFFHWQSWVTGQFGYVEFCGPCRLIVSCVGALQAEAVTARDDGKPVVRRAVQSGVVGFSPRMEFKPVRSEGFWRYCRGDASLFDIQFVGPGVVLSRDGKGRGRDGFRAQVLKLGGV
jgi:VIT1/CCC1 family predicted Fe2+/Mn2+ transporter